MAEEVQYASSGVESNKRKYEDSTPPRRATGFSSQPDSGGGMYNSVPPPMSEIEVAKQKAQEIALKFLNNADPLKRPRVENGGGYDSTDSVLAQKPSGYGMGGGMPPPVSYGGYPGPSKKIDIPNGRVGVIIGKGGETIKSLQNSSGAKIQVTRDTDADPNSATRAVELTGTPDQIARAEQLITEVLAEAEAGGSAVGSRRMSGQSSGAEQCVLKIPNNKVGLVIGKGGETIKNMQARTGARIQVIPLHLPPGDMSRERTVQIEGTSEQIEAAKQLVDEVTSENRMRNPSMSGGYPQQGNYQARPPTNWSQPGPPAQQPGYGYVQPGAYPGPPQYNQPPYSGYPPQPTPGGYAAGWDQSTTPQNQQAPQGGYDYYNQQQPPQQQTPTDGSNYGYGQPPAYSQGQSYGQDGYGGYPAPANNAQSGYSESQPSTGYDQSQQGYNSTYTTATNPTSDGQTPSYGTQGDSNNQAPPSGQTYNASGDPAANASYPQAATQPGYGAPPTSQAAGYGTQPGYGSYGPPQGQKPPPSGQPAAYAQPQQSPSAVQGAGYGQPAYPHSQPAPAQSGPPSSGYPPQTGYGAPPPYGNQPGYGQQQPAPYSSSYGSGYPAPAPYSSDATPPQSAQPTGAAKASPPS